ncbi:hypothetical protein OAD26_00100 [bacterium]|nr:hypothetical protein [bacterium]
MKSFVTLSLLIALMLPVSPASAKGVGDDTIYIGQLKAIVAYIQETLLPQQHTALTHDELREIISGGVTWFENAQEEGGHFKYEYAPYDNEYLEDDNIVRQAGGLYMLGEVARRDASHTLNIQQTAEQAIAYFESLSRTDEYNGREFQCIVINKVSSTCKLGATSLALAGILGYVEAHPEKREQYDELIENYTTYILAMKKEDEGFRNQYRVGESSQKEKESSFSNGESLMALARYYQYNPREDVREVIDATFQYLKDQPYDAPLYLWIMAALKDMHELWESEEYITYAKAYTDWRVAHVSRFKHTNRNYCAYSEGIASAYSLLEDHLEEEARLTLRSELAYWNSKNAKLQLTADSLYKILPMDNVPTMQYLKKPSYAVGGFLTAHDEVTERIDFTQHCVTTYIQTLVDIEGEVL